MGIGCFDNTSGISFDVWDGVGLDAIKAVLMLKSTYGAGMSPVLVLGVASVLRRVTPKGVANPGMLVNNIKTPEARTLL